MQDGDHAAGKGARARPDHPPIRGPRRTAADTRPTGSRASRVVVYLLLAPVAAGVSAAVGLAVGTSASHGVVTL